MLTKSKIVVLFGVLCVFFGAYVGYSLFIPASLSGPSVVIDIKQGSSARRISQQLERQHIIKNANAFYAYVRLTKGGHKLRAGSFRLSPTSSIPQLVKQLQQENGSANLIRITIPEGSNIWDIKRILSTKGLPIIGNFDTYAHTQAKSFFKKEFNFLTDIPVETIEGYLFPDTYYFSKKSTNEIIVRALLSQFEKKMIPIWDQAPTGNTRPKTRFNFHKTLTIASLIEKEARVQSEMTTISSVFYNRLKKKMPLASDPTIVYALGTSYKKRVLYKDLKIESPYNTYKYSGFMPSPIASMGTSAFAAALNPIESKYLFFVANKDGTHIFTDTYTEHLQVQRLMKKGRL